MTEFIDKIKGAANEAIGKAKVATGKSLDKPEIIANGAAQEIKGKAQKLKGELEGLYNKNK